MLKTLESNSEFALSEFAVANERFSPVSMLKWALNHSCPSRYFSAKSVLHVIFPLSQVPPFLTDICFNPKAAALTLTPHAVVKVGSIFHPPDAISMLHQRALFKIEGPLT